MTSSKSSSGIFVGLRVKALCTQASAGPPRRLTHHLPLVEKNRNEL
ncbi:hypothetical protein AB0D27_26200 [Streptomyces sp. NPDC048415]